MIPGDVKKTIRDAARDSANKRYPPITPELARANRMEHRLGFQYGAEYGYSLSAEQLEAKEKEIAELKERNVRLRKYLDEYDKDYAKKHGIV